MKATPDSAWREEPFWALRTRSVFFLRCAQRDWLRWRIRPSICSAANQRDASGSVVACSIEGTRPILLEIQALICHIYFNNPRRTATGTDFNRVNLLMAVLENVLECSCRIVMLM